MPAMPLGLACVVEATRNAGHHVTMLDLMFQIDVHTALQTVIMEVRPECIGISVRNIDDQNIGTRNFLLDKVKEVVAVCRQLTAVPIVLGGAGYSMYPESALAYLGADFGIEGEGETAFPALLTQLENHGDLSRIPGLYSREHGLHQGRICSDNLDQFPLPGTNILSASASQSHDPWIPVQTRRGCALKCSYCSTATIEGSILRQRSPGIVADWLERWVTAGYAHFFFVDNTFNLPPAYAKSLCCRIVEKNLAMRWRCIVYPKNVDDELVRLMSAAGCRQISLGFESGSEPILKNLNKHYNLEDIRATSSLFARHGIERMGFLLLGGPGETRESVEESLAFADSLELEALKVTVGIRIYPGTQLEGIARDQGVITSTSNLLFPHFYLAPALEEWLPERLKEWGKSRPSVIM
ncbi:B12-binding domain-containing radical SAM protein [Desulfoprunum benzoelyticum]